MKYFNRRVKAAVMGLPVKLQARYFRLTDAMKIDGPDLGMPHIRSMGRGLFEMRLKSEVGIARVFYSTKIGERVVILHCFKKKTQKTSAKDLQLARKRLEKVIGNA